MKTYIIIATLILSSCSILKKDKQTLKKLSQKEELELFERRTLRTQQSDFVLTDSSHNDYTLMLWPKGKFTFSVVKGFEGEAEKMLIKGKQSNKTRITRKKESKQDSTLLKSTYTNEKESLATVQKNKLNTGYNWGWVLALLISAALIWAYRRFR